MEKQSYISPRQLLMMLIMTRLPFSTTFFVGLNAGRSIQDILLAVPVNFVLNYIVAIPILVLLKRHPGKDLIEIAHNSMGKAASVVIGGFYLLFFMGLAIQIGAVFQDFFVNYVIPVAKYLSIAVPLLIVGYYGAVKGIESLARFTTVVVVVYVITLIVMTSSVLPYADLHYMLPLMYSGPRITLMAILNGFNSNIQIVFLAFCAPFLKVGTKYGKLYSHWNVIASLGYLILEAMMICALGPTAARENTPLAAMAQQSKLGVFLRLDEIEMISWILNTVFILTLFIYLATHCMLKLGLNKRRKMITFLITLVVFVIGSFVFKNLLMIHYSSFKPWYTFFVAAAVLVVPFAILVVDIIKRRVNTDEKAS